MKLKPTAYRGQLHWNWKGGITLSVRLERAKFRQTVAHHVLVRDNFTCQFCGQVGGYLQVDHIKSWSAYPELRFDSENCRTLCMACHYEVTYHRPMPKGTLWAAGHRKDKVNS
ncbi:HNH endonuclease [Nakamurella sp. PAMC28650]|uniref:HNH endonuclease n=1 Tax=Nakamurella sp. PAMC28650 TaxID=2762325 RepID=UPI00164E91CE|nr:HNH endonuclease [Nakamurella sp. PAMC28650]